MKKNIVRTLVVLVVVLMMLAGCQNAASTESPSASTETVTSSAPEVETTVSEETVSSEPVEVSLLVKQLGSTFWMNIEAGVKDACAELGWTLRPTLCPMTNDNNEQQIALIEQDLLDPPDLYILCPADSQGIRPAIEQINEAGVPIINVNTKISNDAGDLDVVSFVGVDCRKIANEVAEAMSEFMGYKGNCIILQGTTGSQTGIDYYEGAVEIYDKYPDIVILDAQVANYQRQEGLTVTQNLLQKYDNIDFIHACNLEMAMGARVALEQAGRTDIKICTVNMSEEGAQALKDGKISVIADDSPYSVAYLAVMTGKDYLDGVDVPDVVISPAIMVIDGTDAAQSYYDKFGIQ